MSIDKHYYVVAGYDLTKYKTEIYEDWKWTTDGESYRYNQVAGNIQLFDDPMNDNYLYLGYILACGDEYCFNTQTFTVRDISNHQADVLGALIELQDMGIISDSLNSPSQLEYTIIVFEECT